MVTIAMLLLGVSEVSNFLTERSKSVQRPRNSYISGGNLNSHTNKLFAMATQMNFSYDKNLGGSKRNLLLRLLNDLKDDIISDKDVADAFVEFNLSKEDFDELINLFNSAHAKQDERTWVRKSEMAKSLQIHERTLERIKKDYNHLIKKSVHIKKIDNKSERYHLKNFAALYEEIIEKREADMKMVNDIRIGIGLEPRTEEVLPTKKKRPKKK